MAGNTGEAASFQVGFPGLYVQGRNVIGDIWRFVAPFGSKVGLMTGTKSAEVINGIWKTMPENFVIERRSVKGRCTRNTVKRLVDDWGSKACDVLITVGGGTGIDIGKAAGRDLGIPIVTVPTLGSTDAAATSLSVFYDEDGAVESLEKLETHPAVVVVDTEIIAKSPPRFLAAGIGETISTWIEARYCVEKAGVPVENVSDTALQCAKRSFELTVENGAQAYEAVKRGKTSYALDRFLEALFLLGPVGVEGVGVSLAHSLHDAYLGLNQKQYLLHGEIVGLFTLVQLTMENNIQLATSLRTLFEEVGLPTGLEALGVKSFDEPTLLRMAQEAVSPKMAAGKLPIVPSVRDVVSALRALK